MTTYLFNWNPAKWNWDDIEQDVEQCRKQGFYDGRWSCGVTRRIIPGDRIFQIKLGSEHPRGIVASGAALTPPFEDDHFSEEGRTALYVDIRYDILLDPYKEAILAQDTLKDLLPQVHWSPQASGMIIAPEHAAKLEELWAQHLESAGLAPMALPEEVISPEQYQEGALRRISVNAYERDARARRACLAHHGTACAICDFSFASAFGPDGHGFIHVHHLTPLSEVGKKYEVDPIKDLVPICPNCHAMAHHKNPPYEIDELKRLRRDNLRR